MISGELTRYSQSLAEATNQFSDACRDAAEKRSSYDVERLETERKILRGRMSGAAVLILA